jgi:exopolysaccharide biosynthesis protein
MSYHSDELSIEIEKVERGESVLYVADVYIKSIDNFIPVFANGRFDNGYQTTSDMAEDNKAIFAINSDSANATDYGIIVRYKEIYRNIVAADHLAVFGDGSIQTYIPVNISAESLIKKGAEHVFCFGPRLLHEGKAIDKFMYSHIRSAHPRTAIGMIEPYHYYFVVVDGRSEYSKGMTLEALSKYMKELGCTVAYNLDGGGSSTMIFKGKLINKPEGGTSERKIDSAIIFKDAHPVDFYQSKDMEE